jgi:hypothetical protein
MVTRIQSSSPYTLLTRILIALALLVGLCVFAIPAFAAAPSYPWSPAIFNGPPRFEHSFTVPFEYSHDHIFLTLTINNHPGMVFLFDTGASVNILDLATSQQLGIHPVLLSRQRGVGYGSGKVRVAAAQNLDARLGAILIANFMTLIDLHNLELLNVHHLDGILGLPVLRQFIVEIDFADRLITFYPRHGFSYTGSGEVLDLASRGDSIAISVKLATGAHRQHNALLDLDTGSDATVMLYSSFIRKSHITDTDRKDSLTTVSATAYGIGGLFDLQSVIVPFCIIGHTEMQQLPVFLMYSTPQFSGRRRTDGAVGTNILALFRRVVFDEPHGRVIFERRTQLNLNLETTEDAKGVGSIQIHP